MIVLSTLCTTAFSPNTASWMSVSPLPSISVPIALSKFKSVWKQPNRNSIPFKMLFFGAALMNSAAFYTGAGQNISGERLYFNTKLQRNSNVDRMQVVTPEDIISIMSKYKLHNRRLSWIFIAHIENLQHAWPIRDCLVQVKWQLPQDINPPLLI